MGVIGAAPGDVGLLRRNDGADTIEAELLKAFVNTGMIRAEDDVPDANPWVTVSSAWREPSLWCR